MSHKRVSQLVELTAGNLADQDLFYIIDVSAREGKKIQIAQLGAYLNVSGSLMAAFATLSDTASYIFGYNVDGIVDSSSFSNFSLSSISASWAASSISSSYSKTASFVLNPGVASTLSASWASASISASYSLYADTANNSIIAANLIYPNISTSSYAISAGTVVSSSYAKTASYVRLDSVILDTASYSLRSGIAALALSSSQLNYPNNSTASYAIKAENFSYNQFLDYGIYLATSQSLISSELGLVEVVSSTDLAKQTNIMVMGTVIVPYTSSILVDESLSLIIKSRDNNVDTIIDSIPIYVDISRTVNDWDTLMSGTIKIPYSLAGSSSMYGNYMVFVSGSSENIQIEPTRINRFTISSLSDVINVNVGEPLVFNLSSVVPLLIQFEDTASNIFYDSRDNMIASGSENISSMYMTSSNITSIRYVWSLPNLRVFNCKNNPLLTSLTKMPDSLVSMSCDTCSLSSMFSLTNTTMSYFNCGNNNLTSLPTLPTSLSYLNCCQNNITSLSGLPNTMSYLNASDNLISNIAGNFPYGLTELYLNNNQLSTIFSIWGDNIITMSLSNNSISLMPLPLPTSLMYLDISNNLPLTSIGSMPISMSYLDAHSCSLSSASMDTVFSTSLVNASSSGLFTGSINFRGNGPIVNSTYINYVVDLRYVYGWDITYDYISP